MINNNFMESPTKQDIIKATEELHLAMLESYEANIAEENTKLRKIKAHKRLTLARDEIRALTFN